MPAFRFRLQTLLEMRQRETKQAEELVTARKNELAQAEEEMRSLERKASEWDETIRRTRREFANSTVASGDVLREHRDHIRSLEFQREAAKEAVVAFRSPLQQAQQRVLEAEAKLAECRKQEEILVKFREKQEQKFLRGEELREDLESDELGTMMYLGRKTQ